MNNRTSRIFTNKKKGLDLEWEQEHLKEGRYTLNMVKIDRKVREIISHIKNAEAKKAHLQNKIDAIAPTSFCSYLIKSYIVGKKSTPHCRLSCTLLKSSI